jgi:superfamily I DNA/RNA helicase
VTAGTWQRLTRALRDDRRGAPATGLLAPGVVEAAPAPPVELPAAAIDPAEVAARVAAVAALDPRLHARLVALDPDQQAAVVTDAPAALVRAAVGSGKTTVLLHRAAFLHRVVGVPLEDLAILTFTTQAAQALRVRLDELLGRATSARERRLHGTFHAVALALLEGGLPLDQLDRRPGLTVLDDDAVAALLDELAVAHRLRVGPRRRLRERLRAAPPTGALAELGRLFADAKRAHNAMEFDDLIEAATALLAGPGGARPRWILIDELQDCEPRELALVQGLRGPTGGVFGVGDPCQAIYGWRGGVADGFARAAATLGCVVHHLPTSYRSTRTILDGAAAVLGDQPIATGELRAARPAGSPIAVRRHHDPIAEATYLAARLTELHAAGVPRSALAVLARLRAQVDALVAALTAAGVPCLGELRDGAPPVDDPTDAVRVMTLHAAKGLQFTHVFVAGANLGILPLVLRDRGEDEAEERRLLFVGLTRATETVEVSYVACPHQFGALGAPSPLLYLLPAATVAWDEGPRGTSGTTATVATTATAATVTAATETAATVTAATVTAATVTAAENALPWRVGQAVRHRRYGQGVVRALGDGEVRCEFGPWGERAFPLALCPLTPAPDAP